MEASDPAAQHGTYIQEIGEFGLIGRLRKGMQTSADPDLLRGIGDDAAVYRIGDGKVHVITTDALIEGVHFVRTYTPLVYLGIKAIAVNVSDVVAMNARPKFATVTVGIPHDMTVEMVEELYRGMDQACRLYGLQIIGGDTVASRRLVLNITVIGEALEGEVVYRSGAEVGDVLVLTGDVGASYAGLQTLLDLARTAGPDGIDPDELDAHRYVIKRHLTPEAQLHVLGILEQAEVRPTSMIDVSDGLASEVGHLCAQSGVSAILKAVHIPIDLETRAVAEQREEDVDTYALYGGEDYQLLMTLSPEDVSRLDPEQFLVIGEIVEGADEAPRIKGPDGTLHPMQSLGFTHF